MLRGAVPLVIAHRGAAGHRPEHTVAAFTLATAMRADAIEIDLVPSRDGALVVRHEGELSASTDVAEIRTFAGRRTTRTIDGSQTTGWFCEDFTLAELALLRARERYPGLRPASARFDGRYPLMTLDGVLALRARLSGRSRRPLVVYVEVKSPAYYASVGLPVEMALMQTLRRHGLDRRHAPAVVQCFEPRFLAGLRQRHGAAVRTMLLAPATDRPLGEHAAAGALTYDELLRPSGLARLAKIVDGIGVEKQRVLAPCGERAGPTSSLVSDAHAAGLHVNVWALRAENAFLPAELRVAGPPWATGSAAREHAAFLAGGVDGVITDHPGIGVRTRAALWQRGMRPAA